MTELSEREREIARLIALDLSVKEIAARLDIAIGTAKHHRKRICTKLGGGTARVTLWAVRDSPAGHEAPHIVASRRNRAVKQEVIRGLPAVTGA